jgi:hypothetical protein
MLSVDANGTTKHKTISKIIVGFIDLPPETTRALIAEVFSSSFFPSPSTMKNGQFNQLTLVKPSSIGKNGELFGRASILFAKESISRTI